MIQFNLPTKVVFGIDSLDVLAREVEPLGVSSVLLVSGRGAMRLLGVIGRVENALSGHRIVLYDKVSPEPDTGLVDEGVRLAKTEGCEAVVGLGGGSVLDVAKAIAGLVREEDFSTVVDYLEGEGNRKLNSAGIPFLAVPTTAGTGSEVTMNSVIINRSTRSKRSFRSPYLFSRTAIIDPRLTLTLPASISASSGMDALTHLIEGYVSLGSNWFTDALALEGIRLVAGNLIPAVKSGDDLDVRENMCRASLLGGILIANSGLGIVHGVASFLGALDRIGHGLACGILLPYAMEYNQSVSQDKFRQIAVAMGREMTGVGDKEACEAAIAEVKKIASEAGMPKRLRELGVKEEDFPLLAEKSLTSSSIKKNPRPATYENLLEFLGKAF